MSLAFTVDITASVIVARVKRNDDEGSLVSFPYPCQGLSYFQLLYYTRNCVAGRSGIDRKRNLFPRFKLERNQNQIWSCTGRLFKTRTSSLYQGMNFAVRYCPHVIISERLIRASWSVDEKGAIYVIPFFQGHIGVFLLDVPKRQNISAASRSITTATSNR